MSELVWSIKNGELDQVQEAFESKVTMKRLHQQFAKNAGSIDVNSEINGRYPLHYAADYGQYDVLEYLIKKGANVNLSDKHGISPLLAAIWEGHTKCVELLLAKGALKNGSTPEGKSYLEAAEKDDIRKLLS